MLSDLPILDLRLTVVKPYIWDIFHIRCFVMEYNIMLWRTLDLLILYRLWSTLNLFILISGIIGGGLGIGSW